MATPVKIFKLLNNWIKPEENQDPPVFHSTLIEGERGALAEFDLQSRLCSPVRVLTLLELVDGQWLRRKEYTYTPPSKE